MILATKALRTKIGGSSSSNRQAMTAIHHMLSYTELHDLHGTKSQAVAMLERRLRVVIGQLSTATNSSLLEDC